MRAPLWPTELSRRSTPPGTRTRNRSLRRRPRFPLCASGVRLSKESNPAQCRPGDSNPASFRGKSPVPVLSGASGNWPPRSRTERYRLIRAAPSTGWVVASGRRRCRTSRHGDRHRLSGPVAAPAAHLPFLRGERRTRTATLLRPSAFETAPATLAGSLSTADLPMPLT